MSSRSRADKYLLPTGIAAVGGLLIIAPLFLKAPADYATFAARDAVKQSEEINRDRIQQRKQTAELIRKTGLLPEGNTLRLVDYDDGTKPPKIKRQILQSYLADQILHVYDRSNVCIGKIENRQFIWKKKFSDACNNAPVITDDN